MRRTRALVLLGHGSTHDAESSAPIRLHADGLRRRGLFDEVLAAFWKSEPSLRHTLDLTQSDDLFVVPFFISEGYFTRQVIPRELKLQGKMTPHGNRRIFYAKPVGTHSAMTAVLLHCAEAVIRENRSPAPPSRATTLIVVGHGTTRDERSGEAILRQVVLLKRTRRFAAVLAAFLEQSPSVENILQKVKTPNVIAVPFFVSNGPHTRQDVPVAMGFAKKGRSWKNPVDLASPRTPKGSRHAPLRLWYASPVGMDPQMVDVILERVRELES